MSIDPLQTSSEEPELTEEVPVIDLSFDSDSEAETIVVFENFPEIQISSVYSLYAWEKRISHECSRPVPRIKILQDKILPALERVDLPQFSFGTSGSYFNIEHFQLCPKNRCITVAQTNDCSSTENKDVKNFISRLAYHLTTLESSLSSRQVHPEG